MRRVNGLLKPNVFHRLVKKHNLKNVGYESKWEYREDGIKTLLIDIEGKVNPKSKSDIKEISQVYTSLVMKYYLENEKHLIPQHGYNIVINRQDGELLISGLVGNPYQEFNSGSVELN